MKDYKTPEFEVLRIPSVDIICTSGGTEGTDTPIVDEDLIG